MKPKVSIVIPVYNGSNYMKEAIDSALNQTYKNCEVIVVNDGSNDGGKTDSIAKSYGGRIRYFKKENGGVATAINLGIKNMTGEYFAWLSHDDVFYKDKIEKQINAVMNCGDKTAICHGNYDYWLMKNNIREEFNLLEQYTVSQLEDGNFPVVFLAMSGSTVLIHKSNFDRVGLYRENLPTTQDSEFLFRAMRNHKVVFVKDSIITVRVHDEQGHITMMDTHKIEANDMFINFCEELTKEEKEHFCKTELNFYYKLYFLLRSTYIKDAAIDYIIDKINLLNSQNIEKKDLYQENEYICDMKNYSKSNNLYIFGAGKYGKDAVDFLKSYRIDNLGFIDNDIKKDNTFINNILCRHISNIEDIENKYIIVAMQDSREVIEQLKRLKVKNIIKYTNLKKKLFFELPEVMI